jgi:hypothetical protein
VEFPGAVYHVTARGDGRDVIFLEDADRRPLLDLLGRAYRAYGYRLADIAQHLGVHYSTVSPRLKEFEAR